MYKVGMYGGSFDPLHIGHLTNILRAASMCEELYVILSYSDNRDNIPRNERYRWIYNSTKHIGNVKVLCIEDKASSKEEYNDSCWEQGAKDIKKAIGKPIDIVFCGDEYRGKYFEKLYENSFIYYFSRAEIPISSTQIRNNPYKYWDYIPNICKEHYVKKVLLIGGESSGKSVLTQNLSLAYNTNFVSEVGRDTCEYAGGEDFMTSNDLIENLLKQRINVDEAKKHSNKVLFVDTDALTTKFYINFLLDETSKEAIDCNKLALAIDAINSWDLILFLEPTVAFVQDGTRSEIIASDRKIYSDQIKYLFEYNHHKYEILDGDYLQRFETAKMLVDKLLQIE